MADMEWDFPAAVAWLTLGGIRRKASFRLDFAPVGGITFSCTFNERRKVQWLCEKMPAMTCAPKRTGANAPKIHQRRCSTTAPKLRGIMQLNKKNKNERMNTYDITKGSVL